MKPARRLRRFRRGSFRSVLALIVPAIWLCWHGSARGAARFTVATYNLENYLETAQEHRPAKSAAAKARIRESLKVLNADVVALQELGGVDALQELRGALQSQGLTYPYWELVGGADTNIYVGVLSKFRIVARHPHTNESFLLNGRRHHVSRGFVELDLEVNPQYRFTLVAVHLKSRRPVPQAVEGELRAREALQLRALVTARLRTQPRLNLVVLGDFNDVQDSRAVRMIRGRGRAALIDTRPAERNGDNQPNPRGHFPPRNITWTHYYGKEDTYSRIDYILLSHGMAREWDAAGTYALTLPNWGVASDHRPIIARFYAEDR